MEQLTVEALLSFLACLVDGNPGWKKAPVEFWGSNDSSMHIMESVGIETPPDNGVSRVVLSDKYLGEKPADMTSHEFGS